MKEEKTRTLKIDGTDISAFQIVIPTTYSDEEKADIEWFAGELNRGFNAQLKVVDSTAPQSEHEIVIGRARKTNFRLRGVLDYVKKIQNGSFYLGGNSYWADIKAVYSFLRKDVGCDLNGEFAKDSLSFDTMNVRNHYQKPKFTMAATCNMGILFDGTEKMVSELREAGFNRMSYNPVIFVENKTINTKLHDLLRHLTVYEIHAIWYDYGIQFGKEKKELDYRSDLSPDYKACLACPMTEGHFIWDEPREDVFPAVAKNVEGYRTATGKHSFTNLLPMYGAPNIDDKFNPENYRCYLKKFMDTVHPDALWVDFYPFIDDNTVEKTYFENICLVATEARDRGVSFGIYIQASPYGNRKTPTFREYSWQIYTALSFGAKAIEYFIYSTWPKGGGQEHFKTALIAENKTKTELYYNAQLLNQWVETFTERYAEYRYLGTFSKNCTVDYTFFDEQYQWDALKNMQTDCGVLVGCFENQEGASAFTLVNVTPLDQIAPTQKSEIRLDFNGKSVKLYQKGKTYFKKPGDDGFITIYLESGEGIFAEVQ